MDEENKKFTLAGQTFTEGSEISIDGTTGNIYAGIIPTVDAQIAGTFGRVMAWADKFRTLKVRTNADTPADAKKARELGSEQNGPASRPAQCRTASYRCLLSSAETPGGCLSWQRWHGRCSA